MPGDIFVVHGHDELFRAQVVRLLENSTSRNVIVLDEQTSHGRTIIEKFEAHAGATAYAVVLLTGDDEGRVKGQSELKPRARQNVILELGYFMGAIGRAKVAVLHDADVEYPSDIHGVVYIAHKNHWKLDLAKELRDSGIPVDFNKL
ncbi:hypothetical protein GCM10009760_43700 [Kitasatospora kazusensis]|uniref:CD-NTase-associated protein 12/Pycsar effector protein TIR domain-containing protein n=1 Tax=Kitasatospora kazusensis TaxID=407974 RepID=A0ABN2ZY31_9ACTN